MEQYVALFGEMATRMKQHEGLMLFLWDENTGHLQVWPSTASGGYVDKVAKLLASTVYHEDIEPVRDAVVRLLRGKSTYEALNLRLWAGDTPIWVRARMHMNVSGEGVRQIGGTLSNVQEGRLVDGLEKILSRQQFLSDYSRGMHPGDKGHVVVFDVDDYKYSQGLHGLEFSAGLLRLLIASIESVAPKGTRLYRLEYDRFAAVFFGTTDEELAEIHARIEASFKTGLAALKPGVYASFSCGAANFPAHSVFIHDLERFARSAVNTAKLAGKGKLAFFSLEEYEQYQKRQSLFLALRQSVLRGFEGFSLVYQPQVTLEDERVCGAEALLRWQNEEMGSIPPAEFIPVLESGGLMDDVGCWVLKGALEQCCRWREIEPEFTMSVNLSNRQLESGKLAEFVREELKRNGLPGDALVLELTESEKLRSFQYVHQMLAPLVDMGVSVAIDDFGTGYSSLSYFKELRTDQVKIDRSFVSRICERDYDYKLIEFIIQMAHSAGMEVCVEGVETSDELQALGPLGPSLVQGFYFGRPMSAPVFEKRFLVDVPQKNLA